jgi:hypothetical protein
MVLARADGEVSVRKVDQKIHSQDIDQFILYSFRDFRTNSIRLFTITIPGIFFAKPLGPVEFPQVLITDKLVGLQLAPSRTHFNVGTCAQIQKETTSISSAQHQPSQLEKPYTPTLDNAFMYTKETTATWSRALRASIALNETAVSLLCRDGDVQGATSTFVDALLLLKAASGKGAAVAEDEINERLHKASSRVLDASSLTSKRSPTGGLSVQSSGSIGEENVVRAAMHDFTNDSAGILFRLDVFECDGTEYELDGDLDFEIACVFMNLATALRFQSGHEVSTSTRALKLLERSFQIYSAAHALLTQRPSETFTKQHLLLDMLILQNLLKVFHPKLRTERIQYYGELCTLRAILDEELDQERQLHGGFYSCALTTARVA